MMLTATCLNGSPLRFCCDMHGCQPLTSAHGIVSLCIYVYKRRNFSPPRRQTSYQAIPPSTWRSCTKYPPSLLNVPTLLHQYLSPSPPPVAATHNRLMSRVSDLNYEIENCTISEHIKKNRVAPKYLESRISPCGEYQFFLKCCIVAASSCIHGSDQLFT
jgi:hypothetical protein